RGWNGGGDERGPPGIGGWREPRSCPKDACRDLDSDRTPAPGAPRMVSRRCRTSGWRRRGVGMTRRVFTLGACRALQDVSKTPVRSPRIQPRPLATPPSVPSPKRAGYEMRSNDGEEFLSPARHMGHVSTEHIRPEERTGELRALTAAP